MRVGHGASIEFSVVSGAASGSSPHLKRSGHWLGQGATPLSLDVTRLGAVVWRGRATRTHPFGNDFLDVERASPKGK